MKKQNNVDQTRELERARNYLLESKLSIERLKKGKKVRRKVKFVLKDNIILLSFTLVLLLAGVITPIMLISPPEQPSADPFAEKVNKTLELLESNFTDAEGLPYNEKGNYSETSYLIILSTLSHAMLYYGAFNISIEQVNEQKEKLVSILVNDTFRDITDKNRNLSLFNQFLGLYSLIQTYYILKSTDYAFGFEVMLNTMDGILKTFYSSERRVLIAPNGTEAYLDDQSIGLWTIVTLMLLSNIYSIYNYNLRFVAQDILNRLNDDFYNPSSNVFYHTYNLNTSEGYDECNSLDLTLLALAISRVNLIENYNFENYLSSIYIFEDMINDFTDSNLVIYMDKYASGRVLIRNQCFLTLASYLMRLPTTGNQSRTIIKEMFGKGEGFYEDLEYEKVTAESNYFGLIGLASPEWSKNEHENEVEYQYDVVETNYKLLWVVIIMTLSLVQLRVSKRKRREK
ncbi:MAG: hypothetical protein ACTSQE_09995 [Candidatus Heimdallarchaeaceae archaeon]